LDDLHVTSLWAFGAAATAGCPTGDILSPGPPVARVTDPTGSSFAGYEPACAWSPGISNRFPQLSRLSPRPSGTQSGASGRPARNCRRDLRRGITDLL